MKVGKRGEGIGEGEKGKACREIKKWGLGL